MTTSNLSQIAKFVLPAGLKGSSSLFQRASNWQVGGCARTLYTAQSLGLDAFDNKRKWSKARFVGVEHRLKDKLNQCSQPNSNAIIFTEDLNNVIHLVENDPNDFELVHRLLLKKLGQKNEINAFTAKGWGSLIMRMYYFHNDPQRALEAWKDPSLQSVFESVTAKLILCDLLHSNKMYAEVIEIYESIMALDTQNQVQDEEKGVPVTLAVIVLASCLEQNTTKSMEYAKKVFMEMAAKSRVSRPTMQLFSALALAQNLPGEALEALALSHNDNFLIRNLKIRTLSALARSEDAMIVLRLAVPGENISGFGVCADVLEDLQVALKQEGNEELIKEFDEIRQVLSSNGKTIQKSLNSMLTSELRLRRKTDASHWNQNQGQRPGGKRYFNREDNNTRFSGREY